MDTENLALRPNCLLTRSPLVFVSGPRSLFAPEKMGLGLQQFIAAHGFQIENLWLPFRAKTQRLSFLREWLKAHKSKSYHFVMAAETWSELQASFEGLVHPHSTMTLINPKTDVAPASACAKLPANSVHSFLVNAGPVPLRYRLHEIFSRLMQTKPLPYEETLLREDKLVYDRFLDHCVQLAENEFKDITSRM